MSGGHYDYVYIRLEELAEPLYKGEFNGRIYSRTMGIFE